VQYEYTWRNKWLTAEAKTIDDMIASLRAAADELEAMKKRGVTLEGSGTADDYAMLVTDDPDVAREFGFEEPPDLEEDDEDDEEDGVDDSAA
jgi:hypothetical protein